MPATWLRGLVTRGLDIVRKARSQNPPLLAGFDMRPHPRAQPIVVLAKLGGQVQACPQFGRRIHSRIIEHLAPDEGARRQIVVAVVNVVGDCRDDLRLQNKIQKLVCGVRVRRRGGNVSSKKLITEFPTLVRIGPGEDIQDLVKQGLSGIDVSPLTQLPPTLPSRPEYCYFSLNKHSDYWKKMASSGGFAIHISGTFPNLEFEFWAVQG
jgi:hypothetical protein